MSEALDWENDLGTLGREIGGGTSKRLGSAIHAVFMLAAMIMAGEAGAQGGPCLSNCGDYELPPIVVTPGGDGGGWSPSDPCGGYSCNGGGNDVPPDDSGAPSTPPRPTACESFLRANQPPQGCKIRAEIEGPAFGSGCNFSTPAFHSGLIQYTRHFAAACNMQMQCYWAFEDKGYCDGRVREEAYAGCATVSSSAAERAACVDSAGSFANNMAENTVGMNMMPHSVVRANVACARWKGEYYAVCR